MTRINSTEEWDAFVNAIPNAHLLQTSAWGEFKRKFSWTPARLVKGVCGAQVLFRKLPLGFSIAYIPKGPIGEGWHELLSEVDVLCRRNRAVMLIIEPDLWEPLDQTSQSQIPPDFKIHEHTIQPRRSLLVDLSGDEDTLMARMKQKTRYNIRLAARKGVVVNETSDLAGFYALMQVTGSRDGFALHDARYYQEVYAQFHPRGQCALLQASFEGKLLAALMVFANQERAWYFYGASNDEERNRMPTYLLQWEAMRWAKQKGCLSYDLWGVPDADEDTLESQFSDRSDNLWGVYRFKRGFGGRLVRSAAAFIRVYHPLLYRLISRHMNNQPGQA